MQQRHSPNPRGYPAGHAGPTPNQNRLPGPSVQMAGPQAHGGYAVGPYSAAGAPRRPLQGLHQGMGGVPVGPAGPPCPPGTVPPGR